MLASGHTRYVTALLALTCTSSNSDVPHLLTPSQGVYGQNNTPPTVGRAVILDFLNGKEVALDSVI